MQENTTAQNRKLFFKSIANALKKEAPVIIFGAAVGGALFCSATAAPAILAAGAVAAGAVGYAQYKKENPKASFLHFIKNTLKNKRNQILLQIQKDDVYQAFARVREKRSKNESTLVAIGDEITNALTQKRSFIVDTVVEEIKKTSGEGIDDKHTKPIFNGKAITASRLNDYNREKMKNEIKREL